MNDRFESTDDAGLDRRLAALTREARPRPEVWAGIEARIGRPRRRVWRRAAAVAAVGLVAVLVLQVMPGDKRDSGPTADAARRLVHAEAEAMRRVAPTATGGLAESVPLVEAWTDNQAAIEQLEAALIRDPDNYLLLEFLAEARLRQARLLNSGLAFSPQTRMEL